MDERELYKAATAVFYEGKGADDEATETVILAGLAEYLDIDGEISLSPTQAYFDLLEANANTYQKKFKHREAIIADAAMLSSGTIAGLIDSSNYDAIEASQKKFVTWLTESEQTYKNWQIAWDAFASEQR